VRRQKGAERRGQVLGLPGGGGHREHEPALSAGRTCRHRGGDDGAQRGRRDEIALCGVSDLVRAWLAGEGGA